jgi:hypothetical protein
MLNNIIKGIIRDFVEKFISQDLVLRIINGMFDLLRKGTGRIPGTWDDDALASFEASINKNELAAKVAEYILSLIMPALQAAALQSSGGVAIGQADLEAEAKKVIAEVVGRLQP